MSLVLKDFFSQLAIILTDDSFEDNSNFGVLMRRDEPGSFYHLGHFLTNVLIKCENLFTETDMYIVRAPCECYPYAAIAKRRGEGTPWPHHTLILGF